MRPTLEEERRALLEQIEASRAVYRRMLGDRRVGRTKPASAPGPRITVTQIETTFPRSHTMRWIIAHRWQLAIGVTVLLLLKPARLLLNQQVLPTVRTLPRNRFINTVTTYGNRLLRSRNSLHVAGRIAGLLLRWMQQRRT